MNEQALTSSSSGPQTPRGFLRMASPLLRKRLAPFGPAEHERWTNNKERSPRAPEVKL